MNEKKKERKKITIFFLRTHPYYWVYLVAAHFGDWWRTELSCIFHYGNIFFLSFFSPTYLLDLGCHIKAKHRKNLQWPYDILNLSPSIEEWHQQTDIRTFLILSFIMSVHDGSLLAEEMGGNADFSIEFEKESLNNTSCDRMKSNKLHK